MHQTTTLHDLATRLDVLTNAVLSNKPVLTIEEAAAFTGLSVSTVYKLTSNQEIPHYKPRGKMLYFDRAELEEWLKQHPIKTRSAIDQEAANHTAGIGG